MRKTARFCSSLAAAGLAFSASFASAHGVWVTPRSGAAEQTWVSINFADGPEPGTASMLDAGAKITVFALNGADRKPISVVRQVSGDKASLSGQTGDSQVTELEVVYLPPARDARSGQPSGKSGATDGSSRSPEGRAENTGGRASRPFEAAGRQEFYAKYARLKRGVPLQSKGSEAMKIDFLPEWDGSSFSLMVFENGQPAEGGRVELIGPENERTNLEIEFGTVVLEDLKPGRYLAEVRLVEEVRSEGGQAETQRITRVGTLVVDLD